MTVSNIVEIITGIAIISGLLFAAIEVRQFRRSRERESAFHLFETFQQPEFKKGIKLMFDLPDKEFSEAELKSLLGEKIEYVNGLGTAFEGLGILVKNREIKLSLVEENFGGPIILYWKKIGPSIIEVRESSGRETYGEFIQWLAEKLIEREARQAPIPAYIEFANWEE